MANCDAFDACDDSDRHDCDDTHITTITMMSVMLRTAIGAIRREQLLEIVRQMVFAFVIIIKTISQTKVRPKRNIQKI